MPNDTMVLHYKPWPGMHNIKSEYGTIPWYEYLQKEKARIEADPTRRAEIRELPKKPRSGKQFELWVNDVSEKDYQKSENPPSVAKLRTARGKLRAKIKTREFEAQAI